MIASAAAGPGVLPVIACAAAVAGCLLAEARGSVRGVWLAKPLASAAFLWAALAWGALGSDFGRCFAAGLALCAAGDVLLIPRSSRVALRAGMAAFGLGHACFALGFASRGAAAGAAALGAAATLALLGGAWRWLRRHLAREDRVPVLLYLAVIGAMLVTASGAAGRGAPGAAALGAWLFAASDLAVAQDRFVSRSFASTLWGLPAYYAAQLLIAWGAGRP
jgi:uncharacterized membrane protein YhhN